MPWTSFPPSARGMGYRGWQKPCLLLAVAGRCRGVLLPCVQGSVSFLFGKSINVTFCFVSNRHWIFLRLGYDIFHLFHSVIPYVYVGSSYCSVSNGPLHLCHGQTFPLALETWVFVGGRSRACSSWWLEGVDVFSSRVCIIQYLFCLENPFISLFVLSITVIFPLIYG